MTPAGETSDDCGEIIDLLLIEPNHGDVRLFEENFKEGKIFNSIHAVSDGEEALAFINQRGEYEEAPQPDIILLEPQLPGKSGMEVLSELKNTPKVTDIPIVVLTSSELGKDIVKSHDLEADEYIRKPVGAEDFIEFVQEVENFWLAVVRNNGNSGG
ncbi:response regulator [Halostagnicola bangensis]